MDIRGILEKRITSGILFYAGAKAQKMVAPRLRKYTKEHTEFIVGLATPVAVDALGLAEKTGNVYDYVDAVLDAIGDYGFMKELEYIVDKEIVAWSQDANTIKVKNVEDLNNATIILDGTKLASGTDYTVTDNETVSLKNAMSNGEHDLVVVDGTGKKAFAGKIYV